MAVFGCERPESRVVMGLKLDTVLEMTWHQHQNDGNGAQQDPIRTAPYLETCRTRREASLNKGRGTIVRSRADADAVCGVPCPVQ